MSSEAQQRVEIKTKVMVQEMLLAEIRQAKNLSQEKLAEILQTKQASISKIERRVDLYISTLRNYIEALGGKLEIYADFPEGKLQIKQFNEDRPFINEEIMQHNKRENFDNSQDEFFT